MLYFSCKKEGTSALLSATPYFFSSQRLIWLDFSYSLK